MEQRPTLELVRTLCEKLDGEGIAYCHWKSNAFLHRSAAGDNDLDLLVGRADMHRFTEILCRLGFKGAQGPSEQQMPGVLDYYGYDRQADKLVHVHAHYQLVLGHDATKNYHLPIERSYLASAVQGDLFKVPVPEFELIIFVIRMVLKHSTWDAILGRQGFLSTTEQRELAYLQARVSQTRMYDILKQQLPFVDDALFDSCLQALQPGSSFWARAEVGQRLHSRLRAHARRPQGADVGLKLWRRVYWPIRWHLFKRLPKRRLAGGGIMVAIVGGDGAGKSTAVNELYTWLSQDFETIKVHMGKPAWSRTTIAIRGTLKIGKTLGLYPFMRSPIQYTLDANSFTFPGYPWLLREICAARDRYLTYARARCFASNGGLVICDRFPLPQIKLMDGPQCELLSNTYRSHWLIKFLMEIEKKYYRSIMLPDLLIVLRAEPEIAVQRKTDEDASSVRPRSTEIWETDWRQTPAHVIDANRPLAEVLSELKALVWSQM
jgi:thymidylate kinase